MLLELWLAAHSILGISEHIGSKIIHWLLLKHAIKILCYKLLGFSPKQVDEAKYHETVPVWLDEQDYLQLKFCSHLSFWALEAMSFACGLYLLILFACFSLDLFFWRHCKPSSLPFCFLSSGMALVLETSKDFFASCCWSFPFYSRTTCSVEAKSRITVYYMDQFSSVKTASLFSEVAYKFSWEENT